ncbi:MAG: lipopolysaccharide biosynthesis protein RfbH [Victivallaceae bacterium]|jgi:CDP-6-deoxy-D-xylo-4-hexulose-3-dehydrase
MDKVAQAEKLKQNILEQVKEYYHLTHANSGREFIPGKSKVNYGGRVFDEREMVNLVDSSLEFWLTYGRYSREFEQRLAEYLDIRFALLVNSGSSANLLAFMALTSPLLGERRICRGDEVITVAVGFPTTVAPVIQYGAVPVFVDVEPDTANIDVECMKTALSPATKAVILAHTLGNPFNINAVKEFCGENGLWLIEDNCDALGSRYDDAFTGTFGDIGTSSFYPPHHMTMGEGGAVYTDDPLLNKIMLSMRDWGRDCWCESGKDDTCKCRFARQYGTLPFGYDHKYVYSHFGYNLKVSDMQAAVGCAQLEKVPDFVEKRKYNFRKLFDGLKAFDQYFILPHALPESDPSWFGFLITLRDGIGFRRNEIVEYLEKNRIQTRNLFAGNLTRHPCFDTLKAGKDFRISGKLDNTDKIMKDSFWIGLYPGMTGEMLDYMILKISDFLNHGGNK